MKPEGLKENHCCMVYIIIITEKLFKNIVGKYFFSWNSLKENNVCNFRKMSFFW